MRWLRFMLLFALLVLGALSSQAHGYLIRAIPQDRATLERSPTRLQYWFSEDLEPRFSRIVLRSADGDILAEGGVDERNRALMTLQLPANALPEGAYIVELRPAFSGDGHVSAQSSVFFVGQAQASIAGAGASDQAQPLEVLWKALWQAGMVVLFGATMLYNGVFLPAWGNPSYVSGQLPPRVMRRLNVIMVAGLGVAVIAHVLALLQQTMTFFSVSFAQALAPSLWDVVRAGSRFGDVWNARTFLLLAIGAVVVASIAYRESAPRAVKPFWRANVWGVALLIGTSAVTSHAAGSLVLAWSAVAVHWLHTLATAFWVGGLVVLAWVLPVALAPYEGQNQGQTRQVALQAVMLRYSRAVLVAVAVVVASGVYSSSNWFFSPADVNTSYGRTLGLKVLLVGLLVVIGAGHHLALRPTLAQALQARAWLKPFLALYARLQGALSSFSVTLRLEALLALAVLGMASLLSATPIPQPETLQRATPPPALTARANEYDFTLTVAPYALGVNTYDLVVRRDGALVNDLRIDMQWVAPDRDRRGAILPVEAVDEGVYVASSADLDALGRWWALADAITPDGRFVRAAFALELTLADATLALTPTALTPLAGVAVLLACLWASAPFALRVYRSLNLAPASLLVAGGAIVISAVFLWISIVIVDNQRLETERLQNPPPRLVNAVLPDQASVARGVSLYNAHCIGWQTVTDFQALMNGMASTRDELLYDAVVKGWRKVPACDAEFTEEQRWDVVNYARTLRHIYTRR